MQSRDYLGRMIASLTAGLARISGLAAEKKWDEADRALDEAWLSALGFKRTDAHRIDAGSLRALFGAKATHAAELLVAEASLAEARGQAARGAALREKARALHP